MSKYLDQLRSIESEIFYNMGKVSQHTIDVVQDTVEDLDRNDDERPIWRDELGAISYGIDTLLKVFNPAMEYDIDVLKRFNAVIEEWMKDVEFVNDTLGIPRHKG